MLEQAVLRQKLSESFARAQAKNPAFTLRAFARRLKLSHSSLSEILRGKRRVSKKLALKISNELCLDPNETQNILAQFLKKEPPNAHVELSTEHFRVISDWYHFAILSLAETPDFCEDAEWIAKRLGIRVTEAAQALERLLKLELFEKGPDGKLRVTGVRYSTPDDVRNIALRKLHRQNLAMAEVALEELDVSERDFTALTFNMDASQLPLAKQMIREFQDQLQAALSVGKKSEVYKCNFQLFSLTKQEPK